MTNFPKRPHRRLSISLIAALLGFAVISLSPAASSHGVGGELFDGAPKVLIPATDNPPRVDGAIGQSEYDAYGVWTEEGEAFSLLLAHNDSWLFVGVQQPGTGWIGVALSGDMDVGANAITATLNASGVVVQDNYAAEVTDEMVLEPDVSVGGTTDVLAFGATGSAGGASYEIAIPLESADSHDQHLELGSLAALVAAFNETSQVLPTALNEGDMHFLLAYVARASDDLSAIQSLFAANPSPVPSLIAMAIFAIGTTSTFWRYAVPRKGEVA